jgi:NAD(P)-dependent dehydrogenase (short-subunit alcohol dehydrogenase family)
MDPFSLEGRTAVVTGASRGIGAATARALDRAGARVALVARDAGALTALAGELAHDPIVLACDLAQVESPAALGSAVLDAFGSIDVVVNNAAIAARLPTADLDAALIDDMYAVNVRAPLLLIAALVPAMIARGSGSIINLSSVSGIVGQGNIHVGYNASKGAVRLITKAAAAQHGKEGIRINSVHPGLMPPMRTSGRTADPATRAKTLKGVPLGRAGEVDEVAYAILFLASDESSYVTGAELVVDGGWTAV